MVDSGKLANARPINILLVEDNDNDVYFTRRALAQAKFLTTLHVAADGVAALQFLRREGLYAESPHPDLILLDLALPKMGGMELLTKLKQDKSLKHIPVVVLTSSQTAEDIIRSYKLAANAYVIKPVGVAEFIQIVRSIENFWFSVVTLPPEQE